MRAASRSSSTSSSTSGSELKTRVAVIVMAALLVLYLVVLGRTAVLLILSEDGVARAIGVALAVLPLIGAWALVAELVFAVRSERLLKRLEAEGGLPDEELPVLPSGRVERAAADALFPAYQAAVEREPESWQAWLRLALAYDGSGDRRRARWATRRALRLSGA